MRLIDADAEMVKIKQEIQRTESRIKEWEDNREDRSRYYDVDDKIQQFRRNISDALSEIKSLERYSTAYDVDRVVEQLDSYYEEEDEKGCYIPERIRMKVEDIVKAGDVNV